MNGNMRLALGLAMIARNPATLLILIPAACVIVPVLGFGWLLLKLAEAVFAKPHKTMTAVLPRAVHQLTKGADQ